MFYFLYPLFQNTNGFWKKPGLNLIYKPYQIRILDPYIIRMAAYELLNFPKVFPKNQVRIFVLFQTKDLAGVAQRDPGGLGKQNHNS